MSITLWFDPICPFTWRTSRWVRDVATRRGESVTWRFMSLAILNEGKDIPERLHRAHRKSLAALRVLAAAEERHGQPAVDRLYTAIGHRVHDLDEDLTPDTLAAALADAGLPSDLLLAADDAAFDTSIGESHRLGQSRVGTESGSPVTAIDDGPGFFGPVVASVPAADEADRLIDAMRLLSTVPVFSELKRERAPLS
ncbi:DsbA family protein [Planobispora longispora]|uniref:Thioredoxin-like reductase n=1 Tax=Planobispora longispora TaxID=28887 RepID=A0A8J3RIT6_9ACTN|nr:DsbA family protein [Planobispora longispora]GIH74439.1 thioredoxin-like reductase [Planobispora longispora]